MSLLAELLARDTSNPTPANPAKAANPLPQPAPEAPPISRISNISKGADANGAFCVRWCEAALAAGVLPDVIERLPEAELELYRQHFDACADWYAAAQAAARMLQDSATMAEGRVPPGWTAAAVCQHCGPVWIAPSVAELLDVVDGWPTAPGCPWCHVKMPPGHRLPRPRIETEGAR